MKQSYKHLSLDEREEIAVRKAEGLSLREIARRLDRDVSSVSRELKRNAPPLRPGRYKPAKAHRRSIKRNRLSRTHFRLKKPEIRRHVLRKLQQGLSPEQIAGLLRLEKSDLSISHEAIYQFIYSEARNLIPLLANSRRKRLRRWHSRKHRKSHIPERISITQRPVIVQARHQFGHWEADTITSGKSKVTLLVIVERKSRLVKLAWLPQKSASNTRGNSRLRKCLRFKAPEQVFRLGIALTS